MASLEKRPGPDGRTFFRVKVRLKGSPTYSEAFERLTDARRRAQSAKKRHDDIAIAALTTLVRCRIS
jgi:hypothetical protein